MHRRVVVTGIGVVCAIGQSVSEFWNNCLQGNTVVSNIPNHWFTYSKYKSHIWSTLPEIDFSEYDISRVDLLQYDMVSLLSLCVGKQAIDSSGYTIINKNNKNKTFEIKGLDPHRTGIYMGTGSFGAHGFLETHAFQILSNPKTNLNSLFNKLTNSECEREEAQSILDSLVHPRRYNPFAVSRLMPNAISAVLGIKYSIKGPTNTVALACAAGTSAIGQAYRAIKNGYIDIAITGGSEYWDDYYGGIFRGFDIANTLVQNCTDPSAANCPFDENRTGFLFSQGGSAALVLEDLEIAKQRNANILAEIVGFSESFDAYSMMSIEPSGTEIEHMILNTLKDADITPKQIDYINAHGTGTVANDFVECKVLCRIFGSKPKVNSTKSLLGHTIGASGALEAVVTILSLQDQKTHVCKNLNNPISSLNFVYEVERNNFEYALSHSFAFGGHNAGLAIKRFR